MQQLIYTSIAAPGIDGGDVFKIVETAALKNRSRDITGVLAFIEGRFFQAVEGPGEELNRLMCDLRHDRRHHSIKIMWRRRIAARQFEFWNMKRLMVRDGHLARTEFERLLTCHDDMRSILSQFERFLAGQVLRSEVQAIESEIR